MITEVKNTKAFQSIDIPNDWEASKLGNVINDMTDYVAAGSFESLRKNVKVEERNGFACYVRLTDLRLGLGHKEQKYVDEKSYNFLRKSNLFGNEVLMANIGANVGETWLMPIINSPATIAPNMIVIKVDSKKLLSNFFYYYTHSPLGFSKLEELISGSGHPKINKGELKKLIIPLPPLPEQKAIAEVLVTADAAIHTTEKLIAQKELRRKWLMQQLLTGKKRLKGFGGEWKEVALRKLFSEIKNINDGGDTHSVMTISSKLGLISQEDKFDRVIAGDSLKKYTQLNKGDFAYNKGNSKTYKMGCVYQLEEKESALVPFVYICFKPTDLVNSEFYSQWFAAHGLDRQLQKIITSGARGDGLLNVNTDDFFKLKTIFPSKKEQTAIAQVLQAADKEISLLKAKVEKLREQKKGLMQQLLTGKVRLKI